MQWAVNSLQLLPTDSWRLPTANQNGLSTQNLALSTYLLPTVNFDSRSTKLEPAHQIEALAALEAEDGEVGAVHRKNSAQATLSREPDQRGVCEINVPVRVLANNERELRVRGDRHVHYGQAPFMDPFQEMLLGLRHQKKTRLDNRGRNRDQPAAEFLKENVRLMMQRIIRARVRDQEP